MFSKNRSCDLWYSLAKSQVRKISEHWSVYEPSDIKSFRTKPECGIQALKRCKLTGAHSGVADGTTNWWRRLRFSPSSPPHLSTQHVLTLVWKRHPLSCTSSSVPCHGCQVHPRLQSWVLGQLNYMSHRVAHHTTVCMSTERSFVLDNLRMSCRSTTSRKKRLRSCSDRSLMKTPMSICPRTNHCGKLDGAAGPLRDLSLYSMIFASHDFFYLLVRFLEHHLVNVRKVLIFS